MFVATQLATAATWDAARTDPGTPEFELAAAIAATQALPAFVTCAEKNIQLHGGIGFTWEHDAHVILKRAVALAAVFGPIGDDRGRRHPAHRPRRRRRARGRAAAGGGDATAPRCARSSTRYRSLPADQQLGAFLDSGYALAHWPKPWGRAAERGRAARDRRGARAPPACKRAPVRDRRLGHPDASPSTPTRDQIERWIRPSLEHEYVWCQLFSEPGAGSDAAGIRTRATKVDGGWLVNGQKVWTSGAAYCNRGFATVRTDPDKPKHDGITMMVIDLHASGVDIRPLREASGGELFCEVFFDDVFVADEDVVGPVNGGWRVARSTLGNERVSIGGGSDIGDARVRPARPRAPVRHRRRRRRLRRGRGRRAAAGGAPGDAAAQPPYRPNAPSPAPSPAPRATWPSSCRVSTPSASPPSGCVSSARSAHSPRGPTPGCRRPRSSPAASPSPAARRRSCAARSVSACSACRATRCSR